MKKLFFVVVMFISVLIVNAQIVEKTFADLKNEGNAAIKANDFPKALDLYEQAMVKWGDKPIVDTSMVYNMGICAIKAKSWDKALKYFDKAISMNYKKVSSLLYKSDVYRITKNNTENLKALEAALALSPEDAKVKSKLATYYVGEANTIYTKGSAIILKVNNDITAGKLKTTDPAYIAAEQKAKDEYTKAMPLIDKALSFDPANKTAVQIKSAIEQALKG